MVPHHLATLLEVLRDLLALCRREDLAGLDHGLRHALAGSIVPRHGLRTQVFDGFGVDVGLGEQFHALLAQRLALVTLRLKILARSHHDLADAHLLLRRGLNVVEHAFGQDHALAIALCVPPVVLAMVTLPCITALAMVVVLPVLPAFPVRLVVALTRCVWHLRTMGILCVVPARMCGQGENCSTEDGGHG